MAVAYICEYATAAWTTAGGLPSGQEPALAEQTVAIGAAAPSAVFNAKTRFVRVHVDAICSIKFGPAGTVAATTNKRLAANSTEYFGVLGGVHIISVISNT